MYPCSILEQKNIDSQILEIVWAKVIAQLIQLVLVTDSNAHWNLLVFW